MTMGRFIRIIDGVASLGGFCSAGCILLMTALILLETSVRVTMGSSIFIAEEYSAYLMANFVMLGLAFTLRKGGHIKVTLLYSRFGGRAQHLLRLLACLLGLFMFGLLAWELLLLTASNWESKQQSMNITRTLVFIPQIGLVVGGSLMALQFLAEAGREALALLGPSSGRDNPGPGN